MFTAPYRSNDYRLLCSACEVQTSIRCANCATPVCERHVQDDLCRPCEEDAVEGARAKARRRHARIAYSVSGVLLLPAAIVAYPITIGVAAMLLLRRAGAGKTLWRGWGQREGRRQYWHDDDDADTQ